MEETQDALGVFCDLSDAFDCIHHDTLIRKLNYYGIKNTALDFLSSYLSKWSQSWSKRYYVVWVSCKDGSPQGLILGPFLFLIYLNDLRRYLAEENYEILLFVNISCGYGSKTYSHPLSSRGVCSVGVVRGD